MALAKQLKEILLPWSPVSKQVGVNSDKAFASKYADSQMEAANQETQNPLLHIFQNVRQGISDVYQTGKRGAARTAGFASNTVTNIVASPFKLVRWGFNIVGLGARAIMTLPDMAGEKVGKVSTYLRNINERVHKTLDIPTPAERALTPPNSK